MNQLARKGAGRPPGLNDIKRPLSETNELDLLPGRPLQREGCGSLRPCPWVGCIHNTYITIVFKSEKRKRNPHLGKEVWDFKQNCVLDYAEGGGMTLKEVGEVFGLTKERVRQIQNEALVKLLEAGEMDLDWLPAEKRNNLPTE